MRTIALQVTRISAKLNIAKSIFGEDHIITLWIQLDKAYIYKDNALYVNEINNIPGSLGYYLFTKEGISFTKL